MSRVSFIRCLYNSILFECSGQVSLGKIKPFTLARIAGAFGHVREMFEQDRSGRLVMPSDNHIRNHRLDVPEFLEYYVNGLNHRNFSIYPYIMKIYDKDDVIEDYRECNYGDDYVVLTGPSPSLTKRFLDRYAKGIPELFQNDIASLLQGLRDSYWRYRGSGGTCSVLPNNLKDVTNYAVEHNSRRRRKVEGKQAKSVARLEQERIQKQQEEERERLLKGQKEARQTPERVELVQARRRYEDSVQEVHRAQRTSAAERLRINNLVTQYIDELHAKLSVSRAMEDRVESLRTRLEKGLRARFNDKIMVDIFGSFASGLCCNKSDADMTVLDMPAGISIGELADALRDLNFQIMSLIPNAKVPITTFFDATTKTICDVTIGNRIGVVNSQLINTYRRVDYRFTPLWFAIRQLALMHGILDGKTHHLSSYALALMLIVYLQHITQPPILPKLQKVFTSGVENLFINGHDCSFDRNDAGHPDFGTDCKNTKPTGELLLDFLEYYGKTFDFDTQEINPIDAAIVRRCIYPLLPPPSDRTRHHYSMVIRDPFIVGRNVTGNCRPKQVKKIRNCFLNSFNALSRGDINTAFKR